MNDTVVGLALHHLASALIPPLGHSQCLTMPPFNVHYNSGGIKTCVFHRTISAQSSLQERGKKSDLIHLLLPDYCICKDILFCLF